MKKTIRSLIFGVLIIAAMSINVTILQEDVNTNTTIMLKNAEALADGEIPGGAWCSDDCYYLVGDVCADCYTCTYVWDYNENGGAWHCVSM